VVGENRMDPRAADYRELAAEVAKARPDAVFFGGRAESNASALWADLNEAVPSARLVGTHDLLEESFYRGLGRAERQTFLTSVAQDTGQLPARGQRFVRDYRREFGTRPDPFAAYGYASMSLLLDAIRRAGSSGGDRERVIRELFETDDYDSVVGSFSIDDNGDTSLRQLAGYRVRNGRLAAPTKLVGEPSG
jgi:branched-chain amino acid transport system substrate-binding protein